MMFEGPEYQVCDGRIQKWVPETDYYDVDWGMCTDGGYYTDWDEDTPENRQKYGITK